MRLVTYNIHKARGMDGRVSLPRIASVLGQLDADVVALQEVLGPQAEGLADQLGYACAFGEARRHLGVPYGVATLSRLGFERQRAVDVSITGYEPRVVLRTDVAVGDLALHLFNLHLGTSWAERRRQAERLADGELLRAPDLSGARILLGDLNEWTHGRVTRCLRAEFDRLRLRCPRAFPALLPLFSVDHIYLDRPLRIERLWHYRSPRTLLASDHLPLVADLALEAQVG